MIIIILMGSQLKCSECQNQHQLISDQIFDYRSRREIEQKLKEYANKNELFLYPFEHRKMIQTLFVLGQVHLSDAIIQLTKSHQFQKRQQLMKELTHIDLQELDHLSLMINRKTRSQKQHLITLESEQIIEKSYKITLPNQNARNNLSAIINSKPCSKQISIITSQTFKQNIVSQLDPKKISDYQKCIIIVPIQCFSGIGCLKPQNDKQGSRNNSFLKRIDQLYKNIKDKPLFLFLVNPNFSYSFDKQLQHYLKTVCNHKEGDQSNEFKFIKIQYKPFYPCINQFRQIKLLNDHRLLFHFQNGDLIGFLRKQVTLKNIFNQYKFAYFINICIVDQSMFSLEWQNYLNNNSQIDLVAFVGEDKICQKQGLLVKEEFIERGNKTKSKTINYRLTSNFLFPTRIFIDDKPYFEKMVSSRFEKYQVQPNHYSFSRCFSNILYQPRTILVSINQSTDQNIQIFNHSQSTPTDNCSLFVFEDSREKNTEIQL